jgi:hypothetical protein
MSSQADGNEMASRGKGESTKGNEDSAGGEEAESEEDELYGKRYQTMMMAWTMQLLHKSPAKLTMPSSRMLIRTRSHLLMRYLGDS